MEAPRNKSPLPWGEGQCEGNHPWAVVPLTPTLRRRSGSSCAGAGAGRWWTRSLGKSSGGILVSDFYASYDHYPGLKQRCWAHPVSSTGQALLRDIHKLKALYPEDAVLTKWAHGVRRLYDRGQLVLETRLLALCRPFMEDPLAVQGKLCRRIERHIKSLPRT